MTQQNDESDAIEWESVTVQTIMATTTLYACSLCGALVRDRQTHENWHFPGRVSPSESEGS